jgi:hypothetical protein
MIEKMNEFLSGMTVIEKAYAPKGMAKVLLEMAAEIDRQKAEIEKLKGEKQ